MTRERSALNRAIKIAGNASKLAKMLKISRAAISEWERVPINRVPAVEAKTGIPREELRPDIFRQAALPPVRLTGRGGIGGTLPPRSSK